MNQSYDPLFVEHFVYGGAGIIIFLLNLIFLFRAYSYISREIAMGNGKGIKDIMYYIFNIVKGGKLVIIANIFYKAIGFLPKVHPVLSLASMILTLFVMRDEFYSN